MPTPTGLPKVGEIWERTYRLPPDWEPNTVRFEVLSRSGGEYWSMRVRVLSPVAEFQNPVQLWVDPAYWFSQGELKFTGERTR